MSIESMDPPVKRRYDSRQRQAEAQRRRARVLTAARRRFLAEGYRASLPAIAADAEVSVEAVYKAFGNKSRLFKAVFDVGLAGDDGASPIAERPWVAEIIAEPDPRVKLRMYANWLSVAMPRVGPIQLIARAAAAADTEINAVWRQMGAERLEGIGGFAAHLAEGRHLREGVTLEEARDVLWTYNSVELYELLVVQREWTIERYRDFVAEALIGALLPRAPDDHGRADVITK
jgi:AcrR family transcriptional regulator